MEKKLTLRIHRREVTGTEYLCLTVMGRDEYGGSNHPINLNDHTCKVSWSDEYPKEARGLFLESLRFEQAFYPCSVHNGQAASYNTMGHHELYRLEPHMAEGATKAYRKLERIAKKHGFDMNEPGDAAACMVVAFGIDTYCEEVSPTGGSYYTDSKWRFVEIADLSDFKRIIRLRADETRRVVEARISECV